MVQNAIVKKNVREGVVEVNQSHTYENGWTVSVRQALADRYSLTVLVEVTAPENVAGIAVGWSEEGTVLTYDGVSLETGELSPDGISPVDGFPLLLECCCRGAILESCREELDGEEVLRVAFQNPDVPAESESRVDVWARESDFTLLRAEVSWSGETILTYTFDSFTLALTE